MTFDDHLKSVCSLINKQKLTGVCECHLILFKGKFTLVRGVTRPAYGLYVCPITPPDLKVGLKSSKWTTIENKIREFMKGGLL